MKYASILATGLVIGLAACESGETARDADTGMAVDTVVTQRTVQDTAVVRTDTSVTVDTSISRGDGMVGTRDTVTDTRPQSGTGSSLAAPDTSVGVADTQRIQRQSTP